jgi:short subunit dehydrogenase-like uncharacterized protein
MDVDRAVPSRLIPKAMAMNKNILIYGANGYTAELIIERATAEGATPILAGRNEQRVAALAKRFKLEMRAFALDDPGTISRNLSGVSVVLNCAGPFSRTATALANACIQSKAHYLDITGEIDVFESVALLDLQARAAGVMLMPGTGFDVVPSDCLAAHLKTRMPDAISLTLAFKAIGKPSHGTATTMAENAHLGGKVRRNGKLTSVPAASSMRDFDFGHGSETCMSIPWGDVSTAWFSTRIPNIEVFMAAPRGMRVAAVAGRYLGGLIGTPWVQRLIKKQIDAGPAGPTAAQRARGSSHLYGEVRNTSGKTASSRLDTLEGYSLTAWTAWDIAKRTLNGDCKPGFQTPSLVHGADYILNLDRTTRTDL